MTDKKDLKIAAAPSHLGPLNKFLPGGELGPIANREQYETQMHMMPPDQRAFAEESSRFADLWQYFAEHRMQLPTDIVGEVSELSKLPSEQQVQVLRDVNQKLMEVLHDAGEGSTVRQ